MKRRIIVLALCVALLTALLLDTEGAADNKLNFISINDTLPPDLINTVVSYGGQTYVPARVFADYGLGMSYVYFSSVSTAYLYSGDQQLFFELTSGRTYDGDDYYFSVSAIFQGGTVYLPLNFVCSFFGTPSYANIGENAYGRVLRITTGTQTLSDQEFLRAAENAMRTYYQTYHRTSVVPTVSPAVRPPDVTAPPHEGDQVYLALLGLPDAQLLGLLQRTKTYACFFLTGEEVRSDPDTVRRIACSGYSLGVNCPGGTREEYEETAALLMETARVRTVLTYMPAGQPAFPGTVALAGDAVLTEEGKVLNTAYQITAQLENLRGDITLVLPCAAPCADAVSLILYYLSGNGFSVMSPRITDQAKS